MSGADITADPERGPDLRTVDAFGGETGAVVPLAGGQGGSWRAGPVVLKPASEDEADRIAWISRILDQVPETGEAFRLARPVHARDGRWVVDGWAASRWVDGEHRPGGWEERLAVSRALHAALADVPVRAEEFQGQDPWSVAMRMVWGRQDFDPERYPAAAEPYAELEPLLTRPWTGPPAQVIHGDLAGNVVFAEGLPPGVIDFSPHFAPAPFADAILIADAIAWENAPVRLAVSFAAADGHASLLARAVFFRVLCTAHATSGDAGHTSAVHRELAAYRPVLSLARQQAAR